MPVSSWRVTILSPSSRSCRLIGEALAGVEHVGGDLAELRHEGHVLAAAKQHLGHADGGEVPVGVEDHDAISGDVALDVGDLMGREHEVVLRSGQGGHAVRGLPRRRASRSRSR